MDRFGRCLSSGWLILPIANAHPTWWMDDMIWDAYGFMYKPLAILRSNSANTRKSLEIFSQKQISPKKFVLVYDD